MIVRNGFVWLAITHKAKEVFASDLFEIYELHDDGIDVEIELDRRNKYVGDVMKLVKSGALGLSTGALSHLVVRDGGEVKRWVVGEISLTPTPAEPRTLSAVKRHEDTVSSDAGTTSGDDHTSASQQGTEPTMSDIKDAVKAAINELAGEPVNGGTFVPAPQPTHPM